MADNQRRHGKHADAEDPENQEQDEKTKVDVEVIAKLHHREFKKDEPQAARQEKSRELTFAVVASPEKRSHTGGEHEDRQTEVGDPSGEEENRGGPGEIGGREYGRVSMKEVADMVERHDDHDEATKGIDGRQACAVPGECSHG